MEYQKSEEEQETEQKKYVINAGEFFRINNMHLSTQQGSSANTKLDKCGKVYTYILYSNCREPNRENRESSLKIKNLILGKDKNVQQPPFSSQTLKKGVK